MAKILIRVDASFAIGSGHVQRCLTLARELNANENQVEFICANFDGNLIEYISSLGFNVFELKYSKNDIKSLESGSLDLNLEVEFLKKLSSSKKYDVLLIDHYLLDQRFESQFRENFSKIVIIDDLANRPHNCDILLDQTYGRIKEDYRALINPDTNLLLGSKFSLLRPEFSKLRAKTLEKRSNKTQIESILVTFGGGDQKDFTSQVIEKLENSNLADKTEIKIVLGKHYLFEDSLRSRSENSRFSISLLRNINNMAELMANSDLAIGAGGMTSWERCCLALPCLCFELAENQRVILKNLETLGAIHLINDPEELVSIDFNSFDLSSMSKKASLVTDGTGVEEFIKEMLI